MKNFWKKNKAVFAIVGFLLIIPPLFCWSSARMIERIQTKADLIQEKIIDSNLEKAKIDKIPQMESANAEFERDKESVGTILNSSSKVQFIEYVEALAQETNNKIELKVIDDSYDEKKNDLAKKTKTTTKSDGGEGSGVNEKKNIEDTLLYKQYISMQVTLEGDYDGFLSFLHKLENNKYYVNVISLNLEKVFIEKEDGGDVLTENRDDSKGIFLSPVSGKNIEASGEGNEGEPKLRSILNIIVYTE